MSLYLIKRGPRPDYHRAPFHPVIVCDNKRVAQWEAGWTGDGAWVWTNDMPPYGGWLLGRWQGLDIDYGHVVRSGTLPDGTDLAFHHRGRNAGTWALLRGAVWWSQRVMPEWLAAEGVVYPPDDFTQQCILNTVANDGTSGFRRPRPRWWPEPVQP